MDQTQTQADAVPTAESAELRQSGDEDQPPTMAQQADGGDGDEYDLVGLYKDTSSRGRSFMLRSGLDPVLAAAGIEPGEYVDMELDTEDPGEPMLILIPIPEEQTSEAIYPRKVTAGNVEVRIPTAILGEEEPSRGLGIDLEGYDNDNQLLFEPFVMGDLIGLTPVRYENGTAYVPPALRDNEDLTERAEEEEAEGDETVGGIDVEIVRSTAELQGASVDPLDAALRSVAGVVESGEVDLQAQMEYPPLAAGDRTVMFVPESEWADLLDASDVGEQLHGAVEAAHVTQAEELVQEQGSRTHRRFARDGSAVIVRN